LRPGRGRKILPSNAYRYEEESEETQEDDADELAPEDRSIDMRVLEAAGMLYQFSPAQS
jgi:hypothetical protein